MRKIILLVHVSLDGFVAGEDGGLDNFPIGDENLSFVCRLTDSADAALFGRTSFELLNNYWPSKKDEPNATKSEIEYSNWYNAASKIIFSKTMKEDEFINTKIINENVIDEITKIKSQVGKDILIFGSPSVAQLLMRLDLIDSYWIFVNPVIFGKGIPLFLNDRNKISLKLISNIAFKNGEIAINYEVIKK